jgi:Lhr-like helicase
MIINIGCFLKAKKIYLNKNVFYNYVKNESSATAAGDKVRAYVEHLKAFSIALHLYGRESVAVQEMIFNMYRREITQEYMHVENLQELYKYEKEIVDAIKLNETDYPLALAMLATRNSESNSLSKRTLLKIIRKVIKPKFKSEVQFI